MEVTRRSLLAFFGGTAALAVTPKLAAALDEKPPAWWDQVVDQKLAFYDVEETETVACGRGEVVIVPPIGKKAIITQYMASPDHHDVADGRYRLLLERTGHYQVACMRRYDLHTRSGFLWKAMSDFDGFVALPDSPIVLRVADWPLSEEILPHLLISARFEDRV